MFALGFSLEGYFRNTIATNFTFYIIYVYNLILFFGETKFRDTKAVSKIAFTTTFVVPVPTRVVARRQIKLSDSNEMFANYTTRYRKCQHIRPGLKKKNLLSDAALQSCIERESINAHSKFVNVF